MQGMTNNYDIDLFRGIVAAAARLAGTEDLSNPSLRVIADHIRACTFLIIDGVLPSNEGRGYVLRRIIRRAIRHGHKLGINGPFFHKLVAALREQMGEAYPELQQGGEQAARVLLQEEERFAETLSTGMVLLNAAIDTLARSSDSRVIDGETVFKLYDTYGFPADLTADVARERGLGIDQAGFEAAMEAQRERARAASRFGVDLRAGAQLDVATEFCGYTGTAGESTVIALLCEGELVEALRPGERGEVILARTPFYAESGGQVGDAGELQGSAGSRFIVEDTQKRGTAGAHSHIGRLAEGGSGLKVGDTVSAQVDTVLRGATALNHSATHLLHAALREVLGSHVQQKGSRVAPDRLRFDFSHFQPVTPEELQRIERRVNEQVRGNAAAETSEMSYDEAVAAGAMALFGEKYTSTVRVLRIGEFSMELCGGTHVSRAGDIGVFKILSEGGVASGVRRIEAVTGAGAIAEIESGDAVVRELSGLLRGTRDDLAAKVRDALDRIRQLEKDNRGLRDKLASGQGTDLAAGAVDVGGVKVLATVVEGADAGALRTAVDGLKDRLKAAIIVLASTSADGKVTLVAGVTSAETARLKAGELVGHVASQVGGRGGGRADFAQAGGTDASRLPEALASVVPYVRGKWGL
jgi:alanyl-tRNA synthetase